MFIIPLKCYGQDKNSNINIISFDVGYTPENYLNFNFNVLSNKILYGFSYDQIINSGKVGEHYTTINWDQFPEDRQSQGVFIGNLLTFNLGYSLFKRFAIGIGLGIGEEIIYRNMFDEFHILGYNGYYHLTRSDDILFHAKLFVNYHIPLSKKYHLTLNLQHSNIIGTGAGIGVGIQVF